MRGYVGLALIFAAFGAGIGCLQLVGWEEPRLDPSGAGGSTGSHGAGGASSSSTGGSCGAVCRNDLQAVIDGCTGEVVATCTPDEGCAKGACMADPCKAAELSASSYGCDYWAVKTAIPLWGAGACLAVTISNTWPKPVHLQVDRSGMNLKPELFTYIPDVKGMSATYKPYDPVTGIDVGQVAILFLSHKTGNPLLCPKATGLDALTGVGAGFHIHSDYPVIAHQFSPYAAANTGNGAATLLLATTAWGQNNLAISAYKASLVPGTEGNPSLDLLAYIDKTDITITPSVAITAGPNVPGAMAHMPTTYSLNKGDFIQITQPSELTGSPITSTHPIAVFGAHSMMSVPAAQPEGDNAQEQIPPVSGFGHEYVAVRYKNRTGQNEAPPWRIVSAADSTTFTWEPSPPLGAPQKLNAGEIAEFSSAGPFIVKSQDSMHPFYLGGYMTGGEPYMSIGDAEWVNVVPPTQYLNQYVFFTDPSFSETSLVIVRAPSKADGKTFADVNLQCLGKPLDGWQPIGSYEYTRVDLVTGDFQGVGGCGNGRQAMWSKLPFGVTVWGWGNGGQLGNASYAYPAGASYQLASP